MSCACGGAISAPLHPPAEWFTKPVDLKPGERRFTLKGRVAGYVAKWGQCLLGADPSMCFTAPRSPTNYANAHQGSVMCEDGTVRSCANLGGRVNHKDILASAEEAQDHYANIASRSMRVCYGEDDYGIWAAGALMPDLDPVETELIRASAWSGDWRWRPELRAYDMAGCQLVNTPGFNDEAFEPTFVALAASPMSLPGFEPLAESDAAWPPDGIWRVVSLPAPPATMAAAAAIQEACNKAADKMEAAAHGLYTDTIFQSTPTLIEQGQIYAREALDSMAVRAAPASLGENTGVMVAIPIPEDIAEAVGITEDPPHCTLAYLGKAGNVDEARLRMAMAEFRFLPLTGQCGGIGAFPDMGDGMPVWMPLDIPGLNELAQRVREHLLFYGIPTRRDHAFVPHATLRYVKEGSKLPDPIDIRPIEVTEVLVCHGSERWTVTAGNVPEGPRMTEVAAAGLGVGAFVSAGFFGRLMRGKIVAVKTDGQIVVPGSSVIVNAKPGNPAVKIEVYKRENRNSNKFVPTGKYAAKLMSTLTRWAGPNSANPTGTKGGTDRETREAKQRQAQTASPSERVRDLVDRIATACR